ncbi:hypothetical protein JHK85_038339 [Glycine max]|nr:hypothetical protein JHK85_038339 [Glycine max]
MDSKKFSGGHTVIKLNQSGPHNFISGNKNSCLKNEKLVVIVLADRNNKNTNQTSPPSPSSPAPSPSLLTQSLAPLPAPSQQQVPPPPSPVAAPPQQEAPSPATSNPTPAPVSDQPSPPHNDASSILFNFAGSVGAFIASVLHMLPSVNCDVMFATYSFST